jgi:hypothetical protein
MWIIILLIAGLYIDLRIPATWGIGPVALIKDIIRLNRKKP